MLLIGGLSGRTPIAPQREENGGAVAENGSAPTMLAIGDKKE